MHAVASRTEARLLWFQALTNVNSQMTEHANRPGKRKTLITSHMLRLKLLGVKAPNQIETQGMNCF